MAISNNIRPGRHFLQIPGPTNVPDRVLRAMDYPTIDHRGPDFAELGLATLEKCCLRSGLACGEATTLLTEEGPEFDCERFHGGSCTAAGSE